MVWMPKEKGSRGWGGGWVIRFEKVCENTRSTWTWTETFQRKIYILIWLNSEAEWFHLGDARQFAYVWLVGGSFKQEYESWSYFSEVGGRVAGMRSYWPLDGGSGKQWASASAASWQQGIAECLGCVQVVTKKGERSRSANNRADSADSRLGCDHSGDWEGEKWAEVLQLLAGHSRAICDVVKEAMENGAEMGGGSKNEWSAKRSRKRRWGLEEVIRRDSAKISGIKVSWTKDMCLPI